MSLLLLHFITPFSDELSPFKPTTRTKSSKANPLNLAGHKHLVAQAVPAYHGCDCILIWSCETRAQHCPILPKKYTASNFHYLPLVFTLPFIFSRPQHQKVCSARSACRRRAPNGPFKITIYPSRKPWCSRGILAVWVEGIHVCGVSASFLLYATIYITLRITGIFTEIMRCEQPRWPHTYPCIGAMCVCALFIVQPSEPSSSLCGRMYFRRLLRQVRRYLRTCESAQPRELL